MKQRLDAAMAARGLAPSREQAQRLIRLGQVMLDGKTVTKPSTPVFPENVITLSGEGLPFVSRGGLKLARALEIFPISLDGKVCVDIGASTGGFTDCMLQHGAKKVYAIDVGTGQLHPSLVEDDRVVNMEKTNIRSLTGLPEEIQFASTDVSFISLKLVLPVIQLLLPIGGEAVVLVKPQFEAGKGAVGKNGVVKDPKTHLQVLRSVKGYALENGFALKGAGFSPIRGPEGNIEYLYWLQRGEDQGAVSDEDLRQLADESHKALSFRGERR